MKQTGYKTVQVIAPGAIVDNTSFTVVDVDTKRFRYAVLTLMLGATDIAMTALKVQESDDDSTYTDIDGTVFGTDDNDTGATSTLPAATDDNKLYRFEIDLKGRKRYLRLVATNGDGTAGGYAAAWCDLHEGEIVPTSATDKGIAQLMRIPAF